MAARRAMAGAILAMAVALLWCAMANAEVDCSSQFNAMQSCIEYVNAKDANPPSKQCCTAFNATEINTPVCLCQLQQAFSDPATAPGNVTRANQIPTLCAVAVHPSRCPALLGLAPAIAPVATPAIAPALPPVAAAPAGGDVDCSPEFDSLTPCVTYVSTNDTTPPNTCCSALLNVHTQKPVCLCQLLQNVNADPSATGGLNVTKALELPTVCKVTGASVDNCPALLGQPVASPVESPLAASPTPEAGAPGTPAPEASPSIVEPAGNGANSILGSPISAGAMLVALAALTLHFML